MTEATNTRRTKEKLLFLFVIPFLLYILLLPVMPLSEPDEARYSDIASLMNRTGDYVTPRLLHLVYLEKPPLAYWATALSFKLFGESAFSSRLFTALCAWGCILLVYRMGRFFLDERTGLYSAGVLSTFLFYSVIGKTHLLDMPLTFFASLGIWAGYRAFAGDARKKGWIYLLYISGALGFLTKGLIGIVFPLSIPLLWLLVSRRWRDALHLFSPGGIVLFLLISCPWVILVQEANRDFLWFFFVQEHVLRYTTTLHNRSQGLWFYLPIALLGSLPWSAFLLEAWKGGRASGTSLFRASDTRFLLVWMIFIFVFYSVSSSQLAPYLAPFFLPLAVILARFFGLHEERGGNPGRVSGNRWPYDIPVLLLPLLLIATLLVPHLIETVKVGRHLIRLHFDLEWRLMILPIFSLAMLAFVPDRIERRWGRGWFLAIALLSALFLASIQFPVARFLARERSSYPVSQAIKAWVPPGGTVVQYDVLLYGIDFYNHIQTPIYAGIGELQYGYLRLSEEERRRRFWPPWEYATRCPECVEIYCVTQGKKNVEDLRKKFSNLEVLWENGYYYLLRLRRAATGRG